MKKPVYQCDNREAGQLARLLIAAHAVVNDYAAAAFDRLPYSIDHLDLTLNEIENAAPACGCGRSSCAECGGFRVGNELGGEG